MKTPALQGKSKSSIFAILSVMSFGACFILAPLGSFAVWILAGAMLYFLFMAIWSLIPAARKQERKKRMTPQEAATRAHIAFHMPILISMFLGAILLVMIILFFVL